MKGISKYGDGVRKNNTPVVTEVQGIQSSTPLDSIILMVLLST